MLARHWANMVAEEFASAPNVQGDAHFFAEKAFGLSSRWPAAVDAYIAERERATNPLRWYERIGIGNGAFATVLAFHLWVETEYRHDTEASHSCGAAPESCIIGRWTCAALGDTCLFRVRNGDLDVSFPVAHSVDFDRSPALLGSLDTRRQAVADNVQLIEGTVAQGDDFFVCTDALACWFLARTEQGEAPWETLRDLDDVRFAEWINEAREAREMRNDDVTLVHIDVW
ncbi:MAG TPA: hypothetical protein VH589_15355 [Trebonia sp.]|jgi:hypothetical protein